MYITMKLFDAEYLDYHFMQVRKSSSKNGFNGFFVILTPTSIRSYITAMVIVISIVMDKITVRRNETSSCSPSPSAMIGYFGFIAGNKTLHRRWSI